jgi:hypothetical protein
MGEDEEVVELRMGKIKKMGRKEKVSGQDSSFQDRVFRQIRWAPCHT